MKRRLAILGSTGSIGTQTLDIVRQHRDMFEVELISANSSSAMLIEQAREFDVNNVVRRMEKRCTKILNNCNLTSHNKTE